MPQAVAKVTTSSNCSRSHAEALPSLLHKQTSAKGRVNVKEKGKREGACLATASPGPEFTPPPPPPSSGVSGAGREKLESTTGPAKGEGVAPRLMDEGKPWAASQSGRSAGERLGAVSGGRPRVTAVLPLWIWRFPSAILVNSKGAGSGQYQVALLAFWEEKAKKQKPSVEEEEGILSMPVEDASAVKSEIITSMVSKTKCLISDLHQFTGAATTFPARMFAKATKNFVREVDCGGDLIPVSRLNDLDKFQLLSLVTKKKKTWCWQKPKYHLLSVTLNDVLAEGDRIKPVVVESDFVKYEGKFEDYVSGSIETSLGKISLGAGRKGIVTSHSSFGNLKKQEADMQNLMKDIQGRTINLRNTFLQQMLERKHEVLCILTERIVTTQKCLISEQIQTEERVASMVGIRTKVIKVSVSENANVMKDSDVILEIPAPTAIAYGVIELYIKRDGQFGSIHE
uniref:Uncharacterized protein n=1 Tax=Sphaerodactylus townsendi TaxID=933632 RepID=A0ACB8FVA1_9SAUR